MPKQLNAIFRAAHSIKGSAGTFGFTDLAEVTHVLENLLDRIRKGELALRPEMIDAFLDAGDVLKGLLAAHRGNGEADPAQVAAMCKRLSELTVSGSPVAASPAPEAAGGPAIVAAPTGEMEASFVLELEADDAARTVENLVAELSEACVVSVFSRPTAADQPWVLRLAADADTEIVRGLLEFVARSDSIRIGPAGSIARVAGDSAGAYGFFDEPSAPASVATETLAAGSEGDGFGFFVDVPAPGAAAASASSVVTAAAPEAAVAPAKPVGSTPRTGVDPSTRSTN
jgi:two-component system chemotaxis sensor kinase CheA